MKPPLLIGIKVIKWSSKSFNLYISKIGGLNYYAGSVSTIINVDLQYNSIPGCP